MLDLSFKPIGKNVCLSLLMNDFLGGLPFLSNHFLGNPAGQIVFDQGIL